MLVPLTTIVLVASLALALVAGFYAVRDRLVDDLLLLVAAVVELLLVVQAVVTVVMAPQGETPGEGATMAGYALTLPLERAHAGQGAERLVVLGGEVGGDDPAGGLGPDRLGRVVGDDDPFAHEDDALGEGARLLEVCLLYTSPSPRD